MDRPAKKAKNDPHGEDYRPLLGIANVSQTAMARILAITNGAGAANGKGKGKALYRFKRAYRHNIDGLMHEEELALVAGGTWTWAFADPNLLLASMLADAPKMSDLYALAFDANPPSLAQPWHLIIGFDEFAPGNKLKVDNERKCMNLSFSFRELGPAALAMDWAWATPVCVRSKMLNKVRGGWSHMLARYLHCHLDGPQGLSTAGVPLQIRGATRVLFACLTNILSDGEGLQKALDWKGASSMKPCFLHSNVLKKDSDLAHRREGYVEITCHDCSRFYRRSSAELAGEVQALALAHERVEANRMTKTKFHGLQMVCGLNFNRHGLLADSQLCSSIDIVQCVTMDWVHSALQDGMWTVEAYHIMEAYKALGVSYSMLKDFLHSGWCFHDSTV